MCCLQSETDCRQNGEESGTCVKGWMGENGEKETFWEAQKGGWRCSRKKWSKSQLKMQSLQKYKSPNSRVFIGSAWKTCQLVPKFLDFALLWSGDNFCYNWYLKMKAEAIAMSYFHFTWTAVTPKSLTSLEVCCCKKETAVQEIPEQFHILLQKTYKLNHREEQFLHFFVVAPTLFFRGRMQKFSSLTWKILVFCMLIMSPRFQTNV